MKKHRSGPRSRPPDAADSRLPVALAQAARLDQHCDYLVYNPQPGQERVYFEAAVKQLEEQLRNLVP